MMGFILGCPYLGNYHKTILILRGPQVSGVPIASCSGSGSRRYVESSRKVHKPRFQG